MYQFLNRNISNWDLWAILVAVREWQGVWPNVAWSSPSKSIVKEHRGERSITLEEDFDVITNPVTINEWRWWHGFVGTWGILLFLQASAKPESKLGTITTLNINSKWKLKPWEGACLRVILSLSNKSEISSFL